MKAYAIVQVQVDDVGTYIPKIHTISKKKEKALGFFESRYEYYLQNGGLLDEGADWFVCKGVNDRIWEDRKETIYRFQEVELI